MGRSAVATVAWLATDHQQLMYLLSPEGKTVFYIPGVEVVHKVSTPINLPEESNKIKMEPGKMQPPPGGSRKRAAGLSLDLNSSHYKVSVFLRYRARIKCAPLRSYRLLFDYLLALVKMRSMPTTTCMNESSSSSLSLSC